MELSHNREYLQKLINDFDLSVYQALEIGTRILTTDHFITDKLNDENDVIDAPFIFKTMFYEPLLWVVAVGHYHIGCEHQGHVIEIYDNEGDAVKAHERCEEKLIQCHSDKKYDLDIIGGKNLLKDLGLWNN